LRILITGAGGFIGRKLTERLLADGNLDGKPVDHVTAADVMGLDQLADDPRLSKAELDITDHVAVAQLIAPGFDAVFHLAAIVSANAEADFDLGYAVNLDGTRHLLEALRRLDGRPKIVFASSVAVYGGDMPAVIQDDTHLTPQTSYGAQKAASELLVADYHRKGFVDGRSLRLPTIVVRPGRPNKAASTFASSIIREPLAGEEAVCPVSTSSAMYVLSPRRVVDAFIHAMELSDESLGMTRSLVLPGITATVGDMIEALATVAGPNVVARIRHEPDPMIQSIVDGWASRVEAARARRLGFKADDDLGAIIEAHIEDELGGRYVA